MNNELWEDLRATLHRKLKNLEKALQKYQLLDHKVEMAFICGEMQMAESVLKEYFE